MITGDDIARAEQLLAILRREHAALLAGDLGELDAAVAAKRQAAAQFEHRTGAAGAAGNSRLAALLGECARQNAINGGMVESGLRHIRAVLGILRGGPAGAEVYTRTGASAAAAPATRPLARA